MAEQETTVPMDDKELFNSAMAPEVKEETPAPETPVADEQPRDEQGRFAKQDTPDAAPTQQPAEQKPTEPTDDQGGQVPSWRLREVREAREAAERRALEASNEAHAMRQQFNALQRQLTELQKPKAEPVDFFQEPVAAVQQQLAPLQQQFAQLESKLLLNSSRALAVATHGAKAITEMEGALDKALQENHPDMSQLSAQMRASDDPVGIAMRWHKLNSVMERTGGNLDAYIEKQFEERMKDPAFQAKVLEATRNQATNGQTRPNIQIPPSLSRATSGVGSNEGSTAQDAADLSDSSLFRHAMSR